MPATIPLTLLLLKERADSLRRSVEILRSGWGGEHSQPALHRALAMMQEYTGPRGAGASSPALALESALEWAASTPTPSVGALQEARAALEHASASWAESFAELRDLVEQRKPTADSECPEWVSEMARVAANERQRVEATLRISWPVSSEKEEMQLLAQMKQGQSLGLNETFALAAGVSVDEWAEKVRVHKAKQSG